MRYYNAIASSYNRLHGQEQLEKARLIREQLRSQGLLLDVGAGTGIATAEFQQNCSCIALEPSIKMLKRFNGLRVCGRAEKLPFKSGSFDVVLSITALHHADLEKAFNEIKRVAKQDAKIGISFFKRAGSFRQAEGLFRGFKRVDSRFDAIFLKK